MGTAPPRVKIHAVEVVRTTVVLNVKVVKMDALEIVVEDVMEVVILHAKDAMGNVKVRVKKDVTVLVVQVVLRIAKQDVIQLALDHVQ